MTFRTLCHAIVLISVCLLSVPRVEALPCEDWRRQPHVTDVVPTAQTNQADEVVRVGNWMLGSAGDEGLFIIDASDAYDLHVHSISSGCAGPIAVDGPWVYVGRTLALEVYDASQSPPTLETSLSLTETPNDLALLGSVPGFGRYLISGDNAGFRAIEITIPGTPTVAASWDGAWGDENVVEVAANESFGTQVFLATTSFQAFTGNLYSFDFSDPQNPVSDAVIPSYQFVQDLALGDDLLVSSRGFNSEYSLDVFDVSSSQTPLLLGTFVGGGGIPGLGRYSVDFRNGEFFYAIDPLGTHVLDVADPENPALSSQLGDTSGNIAVEQGARWIAAATVDGFELRDVLHREPRTFDHSLDLTRDLLEIAVEANLAVIGSLPDQLETWNVTDPLAPVWQGTLTASHNIIDLVLRGTQAFVVTATGLDIVDVSSPNAPTLLGTVTLPSPRFLALDGSHAWIASNSGGFLLVDIADVMQPTLVGDLPLPAFEYAGFVMPVEELAFLGTTKGFHLIDPYAATGPEIVESVVHPAATAVKGAGYRDGKLFVNQPGLNAGHLDIYDLNLPAGGGIPDPQVVATYSPWLVHKMELVGDVLYGVNLYADDSPTLEFRGLVALDVQDPLTPRALPTVVPMGWTQDVAVTDEYVMLVDSAHATVASAVPGIRVLAPPCLDTAVDAPIHFPTGTQANLSAHPNPFLHSTEVRFDLPNAQTVSVDVFDVLGRKIRSLTRGHMPSGGQRVVWDGRTDRGQPTGPGVYFVRWKVGERDEAMRVVRLR